MLREDTATNQLKGWLVNRTRDTVVVNTPFGGIYEWLEVKDENGEWYCYDCYFRQGCGMGMDRVGLLAPNEFTKKTKTIYGDGNFTTEIRAFFTVDDSIRYSTPVPIVIDAADIDSPERIMLKKMLSQGRTDSTWLSRSYQIYGKLTRSRKKYQESREAYTKSILLNPSNYRAKFDFIELNYIEVAYSESADSLNKISAIRTMFKEWEDEIPATEKDLWKRIGRSRKVFARWLR